MHRLPSFGSVSCLLALLGAVAAGAAAQCTNPWSTWGAGTANGPSAAVVFDIRYAANGDILIGGVFATVDGVAVNGVARWNGAIWSAFGSGVANVVYPSPARVGAIVELPGGDIVIGGQFELAGGVPVNNIARWDGSTWSPLAGGTPVGYYGSVYALTVMPNGDLVAAGRFLTIGGVPVGNIARWDGSSWSPMGSGLGGPVYELQVLTNGDLVAAGYFPGMTGMGSVARWNGTSWSQLGQGVSGSVFALTELTNGEIVIGGLFYNPGSPNIARFDGTSWLPLGSGINPSVEALVGLPTGDLVAGGSFTTAGGVPVDKVARWDGSNWSAIGAGSIGGSHVNVLAWHGLGEIAVGGAFTSVAGTSTNDLARLGTTCPAAASHVATNCVGPAGPMTLVADVLPWVGSTFRSTATGFAVGSLGLSVVGLTAQSVPLQQLHPSGLPNCGLAASTEAVELVLPVAGTVGQQFAIPYDTALVGVQLVHQLLQGQFDPQGVLTSLSSSNPLVLTVGSF